MPHLEPTYLRYIYDGLVKGSIHPENAAELPDGLIGMYEEAFDERTSVIEQQKLLQLFAIWALLKKEVSAVFVAEVLGETEDDIQEFISTFSAWFKSPESGKYQLYHERLKVYLLQKMSEVEVHMLHEKLITRLERAIEEQKADEFEWYGLEFLAGHLSVAAMLNGDGKKLIELSYSQAHWQRQLKISKGYTWTKNGLKEVIAWAPKYNDDEVIECSLQMVDLHHLEQNAAPQIVALVAEGDIAAALKRIEQFGGNDKEGLKRKFILYMLCLMELTLLDSKDKPYRKEGIEKLLKNLDEQLTVDHSVLNWGGFFSSYLMFHMACVWDDYGLDYLIVYKHTKDGTRDGENQDTWLTEKGPYNATQFEVLIACARGISFNLRKSRALSDIATELSKQGKVEEAASAMQEALICAKGISDDSFKSDALSGIATELAKQGKVEEAVSAMQEALICAEGISDDWGKSRALEGIATGLAKQGKVEEALTCASGISSDIFKSSALSSIATELAKQGKVEEALICACTIVHFRDTMGISSDWVKSRALSYITNEFAKQGKVEEALNSARDISSDYWKSRALSDIATELSKQGKVEEAASAMQEALTCARSISCDYWKSRALSGILAKQGKVEEAAMQEALNCARGISTDWEKGRAFSVIATELIEHGKIKEAASAMQEAIIYFRGISFDWGKSLALTGIATGLAQQGREEEAALAMQEALTCALGISDDRAKSLALRGIATELAQQGKVEEALTCASGISSDIFKSSALSGIATELAKQGNWALAETTVLEIPISNERNLCWQNIANNFINESSWHKALEVLNQFKNFDAKNHYLKGFSDSISACDCTENLFFTVIGFYLNDINSMETLLQKYALYQLFFQEFSAVKLERFNRTLNIQWAIDIKNQLPN